MAVVAEAATLPLRPPHPRCPPLSPCPLDAVAAVRRGRGRERRPPHGGHPQLGHQRRARTAGRRHLRQVFIHAPLTAQQAARAPRSRVLCTPPPCTRVVWFHRPSSIAQCGVESVRRGPQTLAHGGGPLHGRGYGTLPWPHPTTPIHANLSRLALTLTLTRTRLVSCVMCNSVLHRAADAAVPRLLPPLGLRRQRGQEHLLPRRQVRPDIGPYLALIWALI